ncbi:MAG: hypothetical protein ACR2PI_27820 [Hyphomicrobiaceae bacterium]
MRISALFAATTLALMTVFSTVASAQSVPCGARDTIVSQLTGKHKEQQAVIGMAKDGRLLEIWSSYESRSFTVLLTWPTMKSCIVATGSSLSMKQPTEFIGRFEF